MSKYEALVFVHVLAVVIWVGGSAVIQTLAFRAQRSDDPDAIARVSGDAEWIGMRVFLPTTVVLLGAGIWAADEGNWDFADGWIVFGLVVWGLSFVVGAGFLGPESGRIKALSAQLGPSAPEVAARVSRILWISRVELLLLFAVVAVMVAKPGL